MNSQIQTNFQSKKPYMIPCKMGEPVFSHTPKTSGFDVRFSPLELASLCGVPDPVCPNVASWHLMMHPQESPSPKPLSHWPGWPSASEVANVGFVITDSKNNWWASIQAPPVSNGDARQVSEPFFVPQFLHLYDEDKNSTWFIQLR